MADLNIVEIIEACIKKLGVNWSAEDKQKVMGLILDIFQTGKSPKQAIGMDKSEMEFAYSTAVSQYKAGKWKEAIDTFKYLFFLDPKDPRYTFGLAASFHKNKQFDQAVKHYSATSYLQPDNPSPWFHSCDCYMQMNNLDAAQAMLLKTVSICGDKPEHADLKKRATDLMAFIEENLKGAPTVQKGV